MNSDSQDELPTDDTVASAPPDPETERVAPLTEAETKSSEEQPAAESSGNYANLDPKWLMLERVSSAISYVVFIAIAGTVCYFVGRKAEPPIPYILAGILVAAVPLLLWLTWFWPKWAYRRWSYLIGPKLIELRYGVIWQSSVMVPISRLQHVDMQRGPLERKLGLASLVLHTAGTQDATHTIPGLEFQTASLLRDQLIDVANRGAARSQ